MSEVAPAAPETPAPSEASAETPAVPPDYRAFRVTPADMNAPVRVGQRGPNAESPSAPAAPAAPEATPPPAAAKPPETPPAQKPAEATLSPKLADIARKAAEARKAQRELEAKEKQAVEARASAEAERKRVAEEHAKWEEARKAEERLKTENPLKWLESQNLKFESLVDLHLRDGKPTPEQVSVIEAAKVRQEALAALESERKEREALAAKLEEEKKAREEALAELRKREEAAAQRELQRQAEAYQRQTVDTVRAKAGDFPFVLAEEGGDGEPSGLDMVWSEIINHATETKGAEVLSPEDAAKRVETRLRAFYGKRVGKFLTSETHRNLLGVKYPEPAAPAVPSKVETPTREVRGLSNAVASAPPVAAKPAATTMEERRRRAMEALKLT